SFRLNAIWAQSACCMYDRRDALQLVTWRPPQVRQNQWHARRTELRRVVQVARPRPIEAQHMWLEPGTVQAKHELYELPFEAARHQRVDDVEDTHHRAMTLSARLPPRRTVRSR